eukprot:93406-Prymnesium_polylepis.1
MRDLASPIKGFSSCSLGTEGFQLLHGRPFAKWGPSCGRHAEQAGPPQLFLFAFAFTPGRVATCCGLEVALVVAFRRKLCK